MATKSKTTTKLPKKKKSSAKLSSKKRQTAKTLRPKRPPVVTLMGHVDHGKTTLLDAIRKTNLVDKEHGGITQHIGAYQVERLGRKITFIDTPGHAAFTRMRAQGALVTDIVVLVVAADDGVKPQTREALAHIKAANTPYLVAINKVDLPDTRIDRVKGQLAEEGVIIEEYGGDIVSVEISAKKSQNIDQLLEMILLVSDLNKLVGNPKASLEAVVIETKIDKRKGILVSLLVKNGTLQVRSQLQIGEETARVRALTDADGKQIKQAGPSTPVEVLGFKSMPKVGAVIGGKKKKTKKEAVIEVSKPSLTKKEAEENQEQEDSDEEEEKQTVTIILKADVTGTLEAIASNLSDEVEIVSKGVGEVNESSILLAQASGATIYAFNVGISRSAKELADLEKIKIKTYNIIYKLFEDLENQVLKILEPTIDEEVIGEAKIIAEFKIKETKIAGCKVKKGELNKTLPVHLKRGEDIIADAKIRSLKKGKEDVDKVKVGSECGVRFKPEIDFKINDVIISYKKIEDL